MNKRSLNQNTSTAAALATVVLIVLIASGVAWNVLLAQPPSRGELERDIYAFLKNTSHDILRKKKVSRTPPAALQSEGRWTAQIHLYVDGYGYEGSSNGRSWTLGEAILAALEEVLEREQPRAITADDLTNAAFAVQVSRDGQERLSFVGRQDATADLIGFEPPIPEVRELTRQDIERHMKDGYFFLRTQALDRAGGGFHKYVFLNTQNQREPRVHTVYTASILYSFIQIHEATGNDRWLDGVEEHAEFLLSMQETDGEHAGAFHYSQYPPEVYDAPYQAFEFNGADVYVDEDGRRLRYVVGTSAKTIYTLLKLNELFEDEKGKYMHAAVRAGDWLRTMQNEDGTVRPCVGYRNGCWHQGTQESLLYQGQVLSAFSRLYRRTDEERFRNAADDLAEHFLAKLESAEGYVDDDYRTHNSISNSWIVMSLLDYTKATGDQDAQAALLKHSDHILKEQKPGDVSLRDRGRWSDTYYSSGNAWVAEVLTEVYRYCRDQELSECHRYKDAVLKVFRWLAQETLRPDNVFWIREGDAYVGGLLRSRRHRDQIRTDSVAHAVNTYARMLPFLDEGVLLAIPQTPPVDK
ncbi:MAG: hypothetical protein ACOC7K_00595 [bacterium]